MVIAKGLARYSESKKAHFNQWGVNFDNQVPIYWNDLMAGFSNEWINHSYGYTGVLGADRSFGPGYPNHESWKIIPDLVAKCKKVNEITSYNLPMGESVIVYPNTTLESSWAVDGVDNERRVLEFIGSMPAMGIQTDVIGSNLFDEAEVYNGKLILRGHTYSTVFLPYNKVLSNKSIQVLQKLIAQKGRVYFGGELPQLDLNANSIDLHLKLSFTLSGDIKQTMLDIEQLCIPTNCTKLNGAFLNVIPSNDGNTFFLTVMPITPNEVVAGKVICMGVEVDITTNSLAIYQIKKANKPKRLL